MSGEYRDNVWTNYSKNILAADAGSAVFLVSFLDHISSGHQYVSALEVIDLQKYTVIKSRLKVLASLRERTKMPFIFVVGKN